MFRKILHLTFSNFWVRKSIQETVETKNVCYMKTNYELVRKFRNFTVFMHIFMITIFPKIGKNW